MAIVSGGTTVTLDMSGLKVADLFDYDDATTTPTEAKYFDDANNFLSLKGAGLTFDAKDALTGGTISTFELVAAGLTTFKIESIPNVKVTDLSGFIAAGNTKGLLGLVLAGNDTVNGTGLDDKLFGFDGNDTFIGGAGKDIIDGGNGVDRASYLSSSAGVTIDLQTGTAAGGDAQGDTLTAIENVTGSRFADKLTGNGDSNFFIDGGRAVDTLIGQGGNDIYAVHNSSTVIVENTGAGNDRVGVGGTNFTLATGVSVELLNTTALKGTSNINLTGNDIFQRVRGNEGDNVLDGKGGNDLLFGMGGKDTFVFSSALGAGNVDTIGDFKAADDTIHLENAIFTALTATGTLTGDAFQANTSGLATDATDRIIYEIDTGKLFYDADGNGAGAAVQFALLTGNPALTAADFVVI
ncbi:calcium-binding protein [Mesorhizobium sp. CN2-181]|uniref:calcium-binding protein n=1 Tax=Mesorhizobium yinganensis TaxID=3157707 RepID=UPI0032B70953